MNDHFGIAWFFLQRDFLRRAAADRVANLKKKCVRVLKRMVVWSIAYVSPRNLAWKGAPERYAALLIEFIRRRAKGDGGGKFILAIHEALPPPLVDLFKKAAGDRPMQITLCAGDPFLPTAQRIVPLLDVLDFTEGHDVVLADVHDGWDTQETLLKKLRSKQASAAFTCWPAVSIGNPSCQCTLPARLPLDSADPSEYHWHLDAGLGLTTPAFRNRLQSRCGGFDAYMRKFVRQRFFERSVDEVAMETYLCGALPLDDAVFHVHKSWPRAPVAKIQDSFATPVYKSLSPLALEPEADHGGVHEKGFLKFVKPTIAHFRRFPRG